VTVFPANNPPSTGIAVTANLETIGGDGAQAFHDDGLNGDATAGDNIFSYIATVSNVSADGNYSFPAHITDAQGRMADANIPLQVHSVPLSAVGASNPTQVSAGGSSLLTVTVTPATSTPGPSTGIQVTANLS